MFDYFGYTEQIRSEVQQHHVHVELLNRAGVWIQRIECTSGFADSFLDSALIKA